MAEVIAIPDSWRIDVRQGLPEELRILLTDYPRDSWRGHENMGSLTRFWLARHANFRRAADMLNARNSDFLEGMIEPEAFAREMGPGLNAFLGGLSEHHTVEDYHYFPRFREMEQRLQRGFDILDNDHHALHEAMHGVVETGNHFMQAAGRDSLLAAGEKFEKANSKLLAFLMRHLEDEEDLIVPLILEHAADDIS